MVHKGQQLLGLLAGESGKGPARHGMEKMVLGGKLGCWRGVGCCGQTQGEAGPWGSWQWRGPEFWAGQMLNAQIHWGADSEGVKGRRKTRIPWLEGSRGFRQNSTQLALS